MTASDDDVEFKWYKPGRYSAKTIPVRLKHILCCRGAHSNL